MHVYILLLFQKLPFRKSWYWSLFCIIYFYFSSLLFRLYAIYIFIGTPRFTYLSSLNCRSSMKKCLKSKLAKKKVNYLWFHHMNTTFHFFFLIFYTFPICTFDIYIVIVIAGMQHYTQLRFFTITCISHITYNYCFNFYIIFL